jgi:hypothetical protein
MNTCMPKSFCRDSHATTVVRTGPIHWQRVAIAILDSGFYPHPDLAQPKNRIVAFKDVTNNKAWLKSDAVPQAADL